MVKGISLYTYNLQPKYDAILWVRSDLFSSTIYVAIASFDLKITFSYNMFFGCISYELDTEFLLNGAYDAILGRNKATPLHIPLYPRPFIKYTFTFAWW